MLTIVNRATPNFEGAAIIKLNDGRMLEGHVSTAYIAGYPALQVDSISEREAKVIRRFFPIGSIFSLTPTDTQLQLQSDEDGNQVITHPQSQEEMCRDLERWIQDGGTPLSWAQARLEGREETAVPVSSEATP